VCISNIFWGEILGGEVCMSRIGTCDVWDT
jgi:hypothetical protein